MNPIILHFLALAAGFFICQNKISFDYILKNAFLHSNLLKSKNFFLIRKKIHKVFFTEVYLSIPERPYYLQYWLLPII